MSGRKPTAEELRLWREANRYTTPRDPASLTADLPPEAPAGPTPSATPDSTRPARRSATVRPLDVLSPRDARQRHLRASPQAPTLDLHGHTRVTAYQAVQHFLAAQSAAGVRQVRIITGKGRGGEGELRRALPGWLNEPGLRPLIAAILQARAENGGAGAFDVLLKRR